MTPRGVLKNVQVGIMKNVTFSKLFTVSFFGFSTQKNRNEKNKYDLNKFLTEIRRLSTFITYRGVFTPRVTPYALRFKPFKPLKKEVSELTGK